MLGWSAAGESPRPSDGLGTMPAMDAAPPGPAPTVDESTDAPGSVVRDPGAPRRPRRPQGPRPARTAPDRRRGRTRPMSPTADPEGTPFSRVAARRSSWSGRGGARWRSGAALLDQVGPVARRGADRQHRPAARSTRSPRTCAATAPRRSSTCCCTSGWRCSGRPTSPSGRSPGCSAWSPSRWSGWPAGGWAAAPAAWAALLLVATLAVRRPLRHRDPHVLPGRPPDRLRLPGPRPRPAPAPRRQPDRRRRRDRACCSTPTTGRIYLVGDDRCCGWPGRAGAADPAWRRGARAALVAVVVGCLTFLPWLPTFLYQSQHTGTPWATPANFAAMVNAISSFAGGGTNQGRGLALLFFALVRAGPLRAGHRPPPHRPRHPHPSAGRDRWPSSSSARWPRPSSAGFLQRAPSTPATRRWCSSRSSCSSPSGSPTFRDRHVRAGRAGAGRRGRAGRLRPQRHAPTAPRPARWPRPSPATGRPGDVVAYCPDQLGPAVDRLLPSGRYQQTTFPRGTGPGFVNWVDYAAAPTAGLAGRLRRAARDDGGRRPPDLRGVGPWLPDVRDQVRGHRPDAAGRSRPITRTSWSPATARQFYQPMSADPSSEAPTRRPDGGAAAWPLTGGGRARPDVAGPGPGRAAWPGRPGNGAVRRRVLPAWAGAPGCWSAVALVVAHLSVRPPPAGQSQPPDLVSTRGCSPWDAGWYESIASHGYAAAGRAVAALLPALPARRPGARAAPRASVPGAALVVVANLAALVAMAALLAPRAPRPRGPATWPAGRCGCWRWPPRPTRWCWATPTAVLLLLLDRRLPGRAGPGGGGGRPPPAWRPAPVRPVGVLLVVPWPSRLWSRRGGRSTPGPGRRDGGAGGRWWPRRVGAGAYLGWVGPPVRRRLAPVPRPAAERTPGAAHRPVRRHVARRRSAASTATTWGAPPTSPGSLVCIALLVVAFRRLPALLRAVRHGGAGRVADAVPTSTRSSGTPWARSPWSSPHRPATRAVRRGGDRPGRRRRRPWPGYALLAFLGIVGALTRGVPPGRVPPGRPGEQLSCPPRARPHRLTPRRRADRAPWEAGSVGPDARPSHRWPPTRSPGTRTGHRRRRHRDTQQKRIAPAWQQPPGPDDRPPTAPRRPSGRRPGGGHRRRAGRTHRGLPARPGRRSGGRGRGRTRSSGASAGPSSATDGASTSAATASSPRSSRSRSSGTRSCPPRTSSCAPG